MGIFREYAGEEAYSQWLHLYSNNTEQLSSKPVVMVDNQTSKLTPYKLQASYKQLQAACFERNDYICKILYSTKTD